MLQLVQPEIRHGGGFKVVVHRHHAAFVFEFVQHFLASLQRPGLIFQIKCVLRLLLAARRVVGFAAFFIWPSTNY
jgi:hypothetical protein